MLVVLMSLSFIDACEYDSDCVSVRDWDTEPWQCCNGECIEKYAKCPFWTVEMTIGLVFVCAVAFASSIVCFFCCRCCPGYRHRSLGTGTIIISGQPPYQQFTDHAYAKLGCLLVRYCWLVLSAASCPSAVPHEAPHGSRGLPGGDSCPKYGTEASRHALFRVCSGLGAIIIR